MWILSSSRFEEVFGLVVTIVCTLAAIGFGIAAGVIELMPYIVMAAMFASIAIVFALVTIKINMSWVSKNKRRLK